ncbi:MULTISPECIES: Gfo/Idh/MocA family protein [Crateriforma]|uniref:1,5-anhydro-D-fructose reductase n=1 Tax=Crateriforma conspicua TaxID=2527996 RepID=A0A5C6FKA4_9PLAN|nr:MULTISPECIES: Gfo/Idh/MocA family oxidoreductase [Crateriforma]TWU62417.1 1,5-anhydro-D-fructose reductase [Crateriforma conspicua]
MSSQPCRWGFLGAAAIARKNWKAIRLSGNGVITAVASRSAQRAADFIAQCEAEVPQSVTAEAVEGYDALLQRDDIDAVYVPLPTGIRKPWVLKAAAAGKHVLCEKPVAVHGDDVAEMIQACQDAGVQFMDGVMFDHSTRLAGIQDSLRPGGPVGNVRRIQTHFSFNGGDDFVGANIRADAELEPHGCLGDLGWYCIRFTLFVTGGRMPESVSARTLTPIGQGSAKVPGEFSAEMRFDDQTSAAFYCSFLTANQQTALVSGDRGYVAVDDFVLPFYDGSLHWTENRHDLQVDNCRWNFRRVSDGRRVDEFAGGEPDAQEVRMVRHLGDIALSGQLESHWPEISLKTQRVLDACRQSAAEQGAVVPIESS